jgi:hypothetical protein
MHVISRRPLRCAPVLERKGEIIDPMREQCYEVIQNVLLHPESAGIYTDLFITGEKRIFARLATVDVPEASLSHMATDLTGALAAGFKGMGQSAGLISRNLALLEPRRLARQHASDERVRFHGLSLQARIRSGARVVASGDARAFKLHPGFDDIGVIEIVLADGTSLMVGVKGASELLGRLQLWMIGQPVEISCDRQGLDESLPRQVELLGWVEEPSKYPDITLDDCERAGSSRIYCEGLVRVLTNYPWPRRDRFCQLVKARSPKLAYGIGSALAASPGSMAGAALLGIVAGVFFVGAVASYFNTRPEIRSGELWPVIISAVAIAFVPVLAAILRRNIRRNRQLAAKLCE